MTAATPTALPFYSPNEGGGHFYSLVWCAARFPPAESSVSARLVLRYCPSVGFSRFSLFAYGDEGDLRMYQRGPDHSSAVEAALIDAWLALGVPAFAWHLFPFEQSFASEDHERAYAGARQEVCRALYRARMQAWANNMTSGGALFLPPPDGFLPIDPFAANQENEELLRALIGREGGNVDGSP